MSVLIRLGPVDIRLVLVREDDGESGPDPLFTSDADLTMMELYELVHD